VILNKAVKREYDNGMGTDWSALLSFLDDLDVKDAAASSRDETKFVLAYIGNKGGIKTFSEKLLDRLEQKALQAVASTVGKHGLVQVSV
jgi:hypothetical protein